MNKFSVDYTDLQSKLSKKRAFRLSDVKEKIKKVAFDIVRFVDSDNVDDLWQIHRDGEDEYIVAMYDEQSEKKASASATTNWKAIPDGSRKNIHIFYKDIAIKKIALAPLGIPEDDAWLMSYSISQKLTSDQSFFNSFVKDLTSIEKQVLKQAEPSIMAGKY